MHLISVGGAVVNGQTPCDVLTLTLLHRTPRGMWTCMYTYVRHHKHSTMGHNADKHNCMHHTRHTARGLGFATVCAVGGVTIAAGGLFVAYFSHSML